MEALSPTMEEGRVISWHKHEGDSVTVGDVLAEVETDKAIMELQARGDGILRAILAGEGATVEVGKLLAVIADADENIDEIIETGKRGEAKQEAVTAAQPPPRPSPAPSASGPPRTGRIKASPLARRLAQERGLDLGSITGSGPGGRIVKRDLEAAVAEPAAATIVAGGYEDVPLGLMRKTIARRLVESLGPIPHFFLTTEVDMQRAAEARRQLNDLGEQRISYNDIILKVVAAALRQHRACNAWWQGDHIRYFNEVHIGMAVAVDGGLITPVIRNTDLKSLREIAVESRELAARARERKLAPEEYILYAASAIRVVYQELVRRGN